MDGVGGTTDDTSGKIPGRKIPETGGMKNGEKTLSKGFELLEVIGRSRDGRKGRDIAEELDMPVSTVFRQLKFLTERGYLRCSGGVYTLGSALVRLGGEAQRQNPLARLAHPVLAALSEATSETVHLAELRDDQAVYVDKVEGSRPVRMGSMIGRSCPLYCTGVGKAMLAFLPERERKRLLDTMRLEVFTEQTIVDRFRLEEELDRIRQTGIAVDRCEHEPGVFCVASPVFDPAGNVLGALSVSGAELYLRPNFDAVAAQLRSAVAALAAQLR